MERNTLLAIVLSALVLFTYQAIFVAPKHAPLMTNAQIPEVQGVSAISSNPASVSGNSLSETTNVINKTSDYVSKTTQSEISYSNVGGSLHNVNFIGNNTFPLTDVLSVSGFDSAHYTGQMLDDATVSLVYRDKNWQITKTF